MVARPGPISLPLLAGQNQKVDERLLAPQEFVSISDAVQERDGRQLTRRGFTSYPVGLWDGAGGPGGVAPIRAVGEGDLFVGDQSVLPYWTQAWAANARSRAQGQPADSGVSTAKLSAVASAGICSLTPERVIPISSFRGGREQTSSVCDYSAIGEWLVTCNCDAGAINVTWRSRDTLEVIATDRQIRSGFGLGPSNFNNYTQCSVVCSTNTHETVVVAVDLNGAISFIYYSDPGAVPTVTVTGYAAQMNVNENSNIDTLTLSSAPSFFAFASCVNPTGMRLVACNFTPPHTQQWNNVVFVPGNQFTMCSIDGDGSANTLVWAATSSDLNATTATLKMGTVTYSTGTPVASSGTLTLGAGVGAGIPFVTMSSKLGPLGPAYFVAFTQIGGITAGGAFSVANITARVMGWTGVNAAALSLYSVYPNAVVAGRVMLNSADNYYSDQTFRRLLLPLMQTGASPLDNDTSFDPNRAVFLQNLGANPDNAGNWGYPITGAAEHGLLELTGEVGQATVPWVSSFVSVGGSTHGWTLGAPTKLVRITSNSGDLDTPLTGAYVMTFDVATEGKARPFNGGMGREPLINLPRQGRLAVFRPMRATQCELKSIRANETLIPGLTTTVTDGVQTHSCGFLEAPVIGNLSSFASAAHPPGVGNFYVTAVYEWTDAEGRRYQSAPAVPQLINLAASNLQVSIAINPPVACYGSVAIIIYRTVANGSEFKRDGAIDGYAAGSTTTIFQLTDPQLLMQETLYTSLGEVPNDPPPGALRFARTRDRVWAYGLDRRDLIQASKLLQDGRGIVWSNAANFFVVMPEEVIAVETLDETAVVFTADAIYTIGGSGPDDTGTGTFAEPGRIPGYVGCVSAKSVISGDAGIYFLSQRGIELLPRGFAPPQWVGQPVMTDLATYTECRGAVADVENDQLLWSFVNPTTWEERIVALNIRNQTWSTWNVPKTGPFSALNSQVPSVGLTIGGDNTTRGAYLPKRPILWTDTDARVRIQQPISAVDAFKTPGGAANTSVVTGTWTSGWMRFAGTSGWQIIRRMSLTVTPQLSSWALGLTMYFNDDMGTPYSCSWDSTFIAFTSRSVTLSVNLPIVQFESIKYVLTASSSDSGQSASGAAVYVHSVMLHPESEGARLPKENRR